MQVSRGYQLILRKAALPVTLVLLELLRDIDRKSSVDDF
jgi:hypothetical protein